MRVRSVRENVLELTGTTVELSALIAAARLAADAMERDASAPPELLATVRRVLAEYDRAAAQLHE